MNEDTLHAYYDLAVAPATFDLFAFLYIAEMERKHLGLPFLELNIVANDGDGFRQEIKLDARLHTLSAKQWRLRHLLLPAGELLESCVRTNYFPDRNMARAHIADSKHVFPGGYALEAPKTDYFESTIAIGLYLGKPYGTLKASAPALERAERWISSHGSGRDTVVLTLRNSSVHPLRNNNLEAWVQFARNLASSRFCPVFVRDTADVFAPPIDELSEFPICDLASIDIEFRLALYEQAYLNLMVDSGPATMCMFDEATRCLRFKMQPENNPHVGPNVYYFRGLPPGSQYLHCNDRQKIVWEADTLEVLEREFSDMVDLIDSSAPPKRTPLPPVIETAKILALGENHEGAEFLCRALLRQDANQMEVLYLLSTVLQNTNRHEEAIATLEKVRLIAGAQPAVLIPLATSLFLSERREEARSLLEAALQNLSDSDEDLLVWAGRVALQMGEDKEGRQALIRAIEHNDRNASAHIDLARHYAINNITVLNAIEHFQSGLSLGVSDPRITVELVDCLIRIGEYDKARKILYDLVHDTGNFSYDNLFKLGLLQKLCGSNDDAEITIDEALNSIRVRINAPMVDAIEKKDRIAEEAQLLCLRGDTELARRSYNQISNGITSEDAVFDPTTYLPYTLQRLRSLSSLVDGRDIFLFCHGPSISRLDDLWPEFEGFDAALFAVNKFSVFENGFLSPSGRQLDTVFRAHPHDIRPSIDQIVEYLERPQQNFMISSRWAIDRIGIKGLEGREFENRFDEKLLYFGLSNGTRGPTPTSPLQFMSANALSILLGIALLSRPRRVFIFGADGSVPPASASSSHYGAESEAFRLRIDAEKRDVMAKTLQADADLFQINTEIILTAFECYFECTRPEIFNVSPKSAINLFPRIDYDEALNILKA